MTKAAILFRVIDHDCGPPYPLKCITTDAPPPTPDSYITIDEQRYKVGHTEYVIEPRAEFEDTYLCVVYLSKMRKFTTQQDEA